MRTGKGPGRFGGPSKAFQDKKKSQESAAAEARASILPRTGDVNLFLDDERLPKEGWTLVRTPEALIALVDNPVIAPRIRRLALDWHLGTGHPNGDAVAKDLASRFLDPAFLPNLEIVHFHSSVREKALGMLRIVQQSVGNRIDDIVLDIGKPWEAR